MNNPLVQPDPGLYIWTIVTFLVLLFLLRKFAWPPLLAALDQRRAQLARAAAGAAGIVRNAERRIQQETAKAVQQIRHEAVDLSVAIASKLLRRNVSKEDNEHLIKEVVDSLDKRPH